MFARYLQFLRALSVNWLGMAGVVLTTSSFLTLVLLEMARFGGLITNAYAGLIIYMALPALFLVGLALIPVAWQQRRREAGKTTRELLDEQFTSTGTARGFFGSRVFRGIAALTLLNVVFLGAVSSRMLHFMDTAEFCGTACHKVMNPEWVTYQASPHARVHCVECHVGEGVGALVDSKINGLRQIYLAGTGTYRRPIPTPVHNLRPARETCEKCHWPEKFYGRRLHTFVRFGKDEASTPRYNTLSLKIDAGHRGTESGVHWHVGEENEVRYLPAGEKRREMLWVEARQPDGSYRRYVNRRLVVTEGRGDGGAGEDSAATEEDPHAAGREEPRTLDCIDCHNRATHIYEDPADAVDDRLARGLMDRSLPYLKREAVAALTAGYNSEAAAMDGIKARLEGFYRRHFPDVARAQGRDIDYAIEVLQQTYRRNIHHSMSIDWNIYPSLIGHRAGGGCFRCHHPDLVDAEGTAIGSDCTVCHSILAFESPQPFAYLAPADSTSRDFRMHTYLQGEFLKTSTP